MDPVTICNMALGWIGQGKIESITEEDADAGSAEELCSTFFPIDVLSTLEERPWLFATGAKPLDLGAPQVSDDPLFPCFFTTPSTVVAVRRVFDASGAHLDFEKREGGVVTVATTKALAIVTKYIEDPKVWTPTFCRAVAARIAADIAGPLTENSILAQRMEERYLRELRNAGVLDLGQAYHGRLGADLSPMQRRR